MAMSLFCRVSVATTLPFRAATSPPASLQTGAQRVTFSGSHHFSRLISFSSTSGLSSITPSSDLVSLLESEIESSVINPDAPETDELPEWFPFVMLDLPAERSVDLFWDSEDRIRTIIVTIDPSAPRPKQPKFLQDDEKLRTGIPMVVGVWKDEDGPCLSFGVNGFPDEIVIDSKALYKFLEVRGINLTLTSFLADYMPNKDKREHLQWLKDVRSFVLKTLK